MTKSPAEARREAEAILRDVRAMPGASAVFVLDPVTKYREDAEASLAADREEVERRQRRAARDQRERQHAAMSAETVCNLVAEIVSPIVERLSRQLAESATRARLNEVRCTALETRCVNAERRIAAVETRAFADSDDRSLSRSSRAH